MLAKFFSLVVILALACLSRAQTPESYCPPRAATLDEQAKIYEEFYQALWVDRDVVGAFTKHVWVDYIQHNPFATSGRDPAIAYLTNNSYWKNVSHKLFRKTFVGGFGWSHHKKDVPNGQPEAVVDILRMNGTCIVEHWDVIQQWPTNAVNPLDDPPKFFP